jgi:signal transduction histidine kinase
MNLFSTSSLILCLSSIFFSLIVYRNDRENPVSKSWFYSSIAFSGWALGLYGVTSSKTIEVANVWQYILDVSAILLPALYFNFISDLFKFDNSKWRQFFLTISLLLSLFSFSHFFKIGVVAKYDFYWVNPGPFYIIFPIYFLMHAIIALFVLTVQFFKKDNDLILKGQIRNTMIAGLMGYIGGVTNFFPQFFNVYPYGNYLVVLFIVFMVYGVLKYKLLSTKVVSAQIFSTTLVLVFLFNVLRSSEITEWVVNFLILVFVSIFSSLLISSVTQEVKARKKIEELAVELGKANEHLLELDQQKSEFVSLASHQLRGPLTAIKGYGSMILDGDFGVVPDYLRDPIDKIYKSTNDLVVLVGDYLDVSRIEQGRMQYDFSEFDMRELVETVVNELKPTVIKAGLTMDFTVDRSRKFLVNADKGKIKQIVGNFLDNSIKYTPHGGIHVWVSTNANKRVLVTISDTGVGIRPEVMPNLFAKFTRAPDANKTNIMGTGLGLYVAKKIIEAHHGRVWAESAGQDKGSSFFIELDPVANVGGGTATLAVNNAVNNSGNNMGNGVVNMNKPAN